MYVGEHVAGLVVAEEQLYLIRGLDFYGLDRRSRCGIRVVSEDAPHGVHGAEIPAVEI
jgi:hypothetical protein